MTFYAIRNRKTGNLLSLLGATTLDDDPGAAITSSKRYLGIEPAFLVGDFDRQPLFVTSDLELATHLVVTKVGNDYRNYILLNVPFQAELENLEIVDLATMEAVPVDRSEEAVSALRAENPNRDIRDA